MTGKTDKSLEPAFERGAVVLKKDGATLAELQSALLEPVASLPETLNEGPRPFPPVPAPVVLTDDVKKALRRLPEVFAAVQPVERRALSEEEMRQVYDEREVLKHIGELLTGRDENLKTIIRHHMDVTAEQAEIADPETTERDASGHYVLAAPQNPERAHIPGTNQDWSREYRKGSTGLDQSVLLDLFESGEITREAYLAMTREMRVFDERKAMDSAVHKPALRADIFKAIKKMTTVNTPGTSLFTRKAK